MTTTHAQVNWTAGDDWQINATLLDETGAPFNLGTAEIKWALMTEAFTRALDEADVTITVTDAPAGKCLIHIPAAKTSPLPAGPYTDVIRIVAGGITSTLSYGPIKVEADPWIADEVAASAQQVVLIDKGPFTKLRVA